jgi:hypothetical protein
MKTLKLILILIVFLVGSCANWKGLLASKGNNDDAIQNAICDFLNSSPLSKDDTTFSISLKEINKEVLGISIYGSTYLKRLVVKDGNTINYSSLPTRYIEKQGKLFYWYDSTRTVTPEVINIFKKYNHIDTAILNVYIPTHINHSKKAEHYYFCRNNLLRYKKIRTKIAMGYYDPPKLNCK